MARMGRQSGTNIVIVGGGFAGVACAKLLAKDGRPRVTLPRIHWGQSGTKGPNST